MDIKISPEKMKKVESLIQEGKYKSIHAFFEQAAFLLIMAEENKDLWAKNAKEDS